MRVGYICEAGTGIGWGHLGRGRALLEAAGEGALLVGAGFEEIRAWASRERLELPIAAWHSTDAPLAPASRCDFDVLVVDHYRLPAGTITALARSYPVFVVDDWVRAEIEACAVINGNVGAVADDYATARVQRKLVGPSYAMVRAEVRRGLELPNRRLEGASIVLTFGGSDPEGRTAAIADALVRSDWFDGAIFLSIVLGPSYLGPTPWATWPRASAARTEVLRHPPDFVARLRAATLVVCGASTTTYDVAYLRTAFYPLGLVDNQARVAAEWHHLGVGDALCVWNQGWLQHATQSIGRLVFDEQRRQAIIRAAAVVDGEGPRRVLDACAELCAAC